MKTVTKNDGGMLFHSEGEIFGHLVHFKGRGVYDPTHGQVDVDPELVATHNDILDEAYIKGLDESCEIGQGGFFYLGEDESEHPVVKTFTGKVVTDDVTVKGRTILFGRKGKMFKGKVKKDAENFWFERIS